MKLWDSTRAAKPEIKRMTTRSGKNKITESAPNQRNIKAHSL